MGVVPVGAGRVEQRLIDGEPLDKILETGPVPPKRALGIARLIASALSETMLAGILGPVLSANDARSLGTASTTTVDIPQFGVLIKALQTNSDVDVLSNPHLLIMNNEEGEISVGSRIPFPVSTLGLGGGLPGAA